MTEKIGPIDPHENPYTQLQPQEANEVMQGIFALVPVNSGLRVHQDDPTLAERRAESPLCKTAVAKLTSLMKVSQFTISGQQRVVESFQNGFVLGRTPPEAKQLIPDNKWVEDFGWDSTSGGPFGDTAKDLEFKLYRHDLAIAQIASKSARKMLDEIKESTKPEEQRLRERIISQGIIDSALGGAPKNPDHIALRTWRNQLIEKWQDEP